LACRHRRGAFANADPCFLFGGGGAKRSWLVATDEEPSPTLIPASYVAEGNYPNPFNSSTVIQFSIAQAGHAQLAVFNILGQRVKRLIDEYLQPGIHRATWDGQDESGHPVASGVYFYRLTGDGRQVTKKMVILK
jgi:hypothetical protein